MIDPRGIACIHSHISGLKISVSEAYDKMSDVFGLGSDIFEMIFSGFGFSLW